MKKVFLANDDLLTAEHPARKPGYRLKFRDQEQLGIKLLQPKTENHVEIYRPGGFLLAVLLKGIISPELQVEAFERLKTVNGHLDNRPGIVGEKAAQYEVRKSDGKMSPRRSVPTVITEKFGGKADMFGYYRYKNPKPGVPKCEMTGWTRRDIGGYKAVLPFIKQWTTSTRRRCRLPMPSRWSTSHNPGQVAHRANCIHDALCLEERSNSDTYR